MTKRSRAYSDVQILTMIRLGLSAKKCRLLLECGKSSLHVPNAA